MTDLEHPNGRQAPELTVERRHEPRAGCPARPTLRYAVPPDARPRWGYAANVSAGGVGFLAVEPVGPGAELELHVLEGPPSLVRVVRVTHCAPVGGRPLARRLPGQPAVQRRGTRQPALTAPARADGHRDFCAFHFFRAALRSTASSNQ